MEWSGRSAWSSRTTRRLYFSPIRMRKKLHGAFTSFTSRALVLVALAYARLFVFVGWMSCVPWLDEYHRIRCGPSWHGGDRRTWPRKLEFHHKDLGQLHRCPTDRLSYRIFSFSSQLCFSFLFLHYVDQIRRNAERLSAITALGFSFLLCFDNQPSIRPSIYLRAINARFCVPVFCVYQRYFSSFLFFFFSVVLRSCRSSAFRFRLLLFSVSISPRSLRLLPLYLSTSTSLYHSQKFLHQAQTSLYVMLWYICYNRNYEEC